MQVDREINLEKSALLRETEAGRLLGLSVHAMRRRRQKRQLPLFLKVGRSVRYRREDIESYLSQCAVCQKV